MAAIRAHVRLLLAWNRAINLTAIVEPQAIALLHVADSLSAVPSIARAIAGVPTHPSRSGRPRIVDLGSGGGFPGVPLAAALPDADVTLLDSVAKKTRFLTAAVDAAGLSDRVRARTGRAEEVAREAEERGTAAIVTARAVGPLADLVELAMPLLSPGGTLVAWKRGAIGEELAAAARATRVLGASDPEVAPVEAIEELRGHLLVTVRKIGPTPPGFPREPTARRRRPW